MTTSAHQSKVSSPWSDSHRAEDTKRIDLGFSSLSLGSSVGVGVLSTFGDDPPFGHSRIVSDGTGNLGGTPPSPTSPLRTSSRHTTLPQSFSSEPGGHFIGQRGLNSSGGSHPSPIGKSSEGNNNNIASSPLVFDSSPLNEGGSDSLFGSSGRGQGGGMFLNKGKLPPPPPTLDSGGSGDGDAGNYNRSSGVYSNGQELGGPLNQRIDGRAAGNDRPFTIAPRMDRRGQNERREDDGLRGGLIGALSAPPGVSFSSSPTDGSGGMMRGSLSRIVSDSPRTIASPVVDGGGGGKLHGRPPLSSHSSTSSKSNLADLQFSSTTGGLRNPPHERLHDDAIGRQRQQQESHELKGTVGHRISPENNWQGGDFRNAPHSQLRHGSSDVMDGRIPEGRSISAPTEMCGGLDQYPLQEQGLHHPGSVANRGRAVTTGTAPGTAPGFEDMRVHHHPQHTHGLDHGGSPGMSYRDDPRGPHPSHGNAGMYTGGNFDGYRGPIDDRHPSDRGAHIGAYQQHPRSQMHQQHHMHQQPPSPHQVQQQRLHGGGPMEPVHHMRSFSHESGDPYIQTQRSSSSHGSYGGHNDYENGYGHQQQHQHRHHGSAAPMSQAMGQQLPQQRHPPGDGGMYDHPGGPPIYVGAGSHGGPGGGYGGHMMPRSGSAGSNLRSVSHDGRMNRAGSVPSHVVSSASMDGSSHSLDRAVYGPSSSGHHPHQRGGGDYSGHSSYHDSPGAFSQRGGHGDEPYRMSSGMYPGDQRGLSHSYHGRETGHGGMGHHGGADGFGTTPVMIDEMGRMSGMGGHGDDFDVNGMRLPRGSGGGGSGGNHLARSSSTGPHHPSHHGHSRGDSLDADLAGEHIEDPDMMGHHSSGGMGVVMDGPHIESAGEHITSVYAHLPPQQSSSSSTGSGGPGGVPGPKVVYNVKFKRTQRSFVLGPRAPRDVVRVGCYVKVEADRGEDLGIVVSRMPAEKYNAVGRFRPGGASAVAGAEANGGVGGVMGGSAPPGAGSSAADLKRILRLATHDEVSLLAIKRDEEDDLLKICRGKVRQRGLPMTVVDAEYQFDRHKLTFFFEAEGRIDFRELVRDLFSIYKTRIWMQQLDKNCGGGGTGGGSVSSGMASPTNGVEAGTTCSADTIESEASRDFEDKDAGSKSSERHIEDKDAESSSVDKQDSEGKTAGPSNGDYKNSEVKDSGSTGDVF